MLPAMLLGSGLLVLGWSAWHPRDGFVWFLETVPAMAGAAVLWAIYPRTRLTGLVYVLIWLHAIVLCVGGHYTYAGVPLFDTLRDTFGLARNHYDRLGHFMQGFAPAMIAREVLVRCRAVHGRGWLFLFVTCIALSVSAIYEFAEWWVALATGSAAEVFLATQGDPWDTQWDMFLALVGALTSQLALSRLHDRALSRSFGATV